MLQGGVLLQNLEIVLANGFLGDPDNKVASKEPASRNMRSENVKPERGDLGEPARERQEVTV